MNDLPKGWWRDPDRLRAEREQHGTLAAAARAHGTTKETLGRWWAAHGFAPLPRGPEGTRAKQHEPNDTWILDALKKGGDRATVEQLADLADVSPRKVREALERLGHDGYRVEEDGPQVVLNRVPPPTVSTHRALFDGERVRFAVVSDTHLGSKHERLEELHQAYAVIRDEGITTVYHPGDLVCGKGIFPGQVNTVHKHTYEDQVEYAVANYPTAEGVQTYLVAGNHDLEGEHGKIGANPVVAFCNRRPDVTYAGDYRATFELEQGTRIYLLHPKGGMSYAVSYKVQKLCESFEGGTKPHVTLVGHYHKAGVFEWRSIRNVLAGCFEGGGDFGARLGLGEPAVGFWIIDLTVADDGSVVRFKTEFFKFFAGRVVK